MNQIKIACDAGSSCLALSTVFGLLPTILGVIASVLSIAWSVFRYIEYRKNKNIGV